MAEQQQAPMQGWNFPDDLLEAAWGLIANAHGGNWDEASDEWRNAAAHWRDAYHATLVDRPSEEQSIAEAVAKARANPGQTFEAGDPE